MESTHSPDSSSREWIMGRIHGLGLGAEAFPHM